MTMEASRGTRHDRFRWRGQCEAQRGGGGYRSRRGLGRDKQLNHGNALPIVALGDCRAIAAEDDEMRTFMPTHVRVHTGGPVVVVVAIIQVRVKERRTEGRQLQRHGDETRDNGPEHWPSLFASPAGASSQCGGRI